ncbi:hypothetical protein [Salinilacihabitans rarus]|uniref:hypothetical protein n=1 Tax=Salinilacihabitans rarus TaxID=2961596 RepID=UPI0020C8802A|nr:hypothetical protein [Salinilacihabitans rarus]
MIDEMRSSPLFSGQRLVATVGLAFAISLVDVRFVNLAGIETVADLLGRTVVHGLGFYLGFTVAALFDAEWPL